MQGFEFSGLGAVLHAVEHFSYHVGQIAFWVKQLCEEDLGFYRDHNLNQLNKYVNQTHYSLFRCQRRTHR